MIHVICRLTAKNRDQPRNPTLGNRVWATFYFFIIIRALDLRLRGRWLVPFSGNYLGQVVRTHVPVTKRYKLMAETTCGWE